MEFSREPFRPGEEFVPDAAAAAEAPPVQPLQNDHLQEAEQQPDNAIMGESGAVSPSERRQRTCS
jgi:hypothetical protein